MKPRVGRGHRGLSLATPPSSWGLILPPIPHSGRRGPRLASPVGHSLARLACTPFQRKVYETILKIPMGEVRTYAQVARMIGQPKAARAVGQALKRNPWAPAIPCHRVVASDGSLGGYTAPGGLARKRRLLSAEKAPHG